MPPEITEPKDRAAINRENAQKSTGPRTEAGKKRSSLNALRHNLTGQIIIMTEEGMQAYKKFTQSFHDDLQPKGALETQLVQTMADCSWRLNRCRANENNIITLGLIENFETTQAEHPQVHAALAIAESIRENIKTLNAQSMQEQRVSRQFDRSMKQLHQLQQERREREAAALDQAAKLLALHKSSNKATYNPREDGFVFTKDEIETHIRRQQRVHQARGFMVWAAAA